MGFNSGFKGLMNVKLITKFKDCCIAFEEEKLFDMELGLQA